MPRPRHLLIINPVSGHHQGISISQHLQNILKDTNHQFESITTQSSEHTFNIANSKSLTEFQSIIIVGGDGTIHNVINGMLARKDGHELPLGFIPAGTGNSCVRDLNFKNPQDAADAILRGTTIAFDLAQITTNDNIIYSHNVIGWGIPVDINIKAEQLRWSRGQRYNLAAFIEILRNRSRQARIKINDQYFEGEWGFVVVSNTQYAGNNMKMAPLAKNDDGLLDVLLLRKTSRLKLLSLFTKIFSGKHIQDPDIIYQQVESIRLETKENLPLIVDGEITGTTPFSISVLPGRLNIFK